MNRRTITSKLCGSFAIVWLAAVPAFASVHNGYARVNFDFGAPTKLKASVTDSRVILSFDKPVTQSPAAIKAALPGYVKGVTLSGDKHGVTLTLMKPYRLRQFVSGNSVGIDLIGEPSTDKPQEIATGAGEETPEPVKPKPAPAKPAAAPAPTTAIKTTSDADLLTTKKPAAAAAATPSKPEGVKAPPSPSEADAMLTTKKPEPKTEPAKAEPAPEPKPVAPAAKPEPAPAAPAQAAIDEDTEQAAPPSPATDANAKVAKAEPLAPAEEAKPVAAPTGPFIVTAQTANNETTINFPWKERTGAAVFKRARDIWVIFSAEKEVNTGLLRSVMPKQVVNITQYRFPGNTVLQFTTDGSIYPAVAQTKGGYGWNVILGNNPGQPSLDVSIMPDTLEGTTRLILGAYDVAPPVRFFDPNVGDELIIVPSFENGRATFNERNFPELTVLSTTQGIAVVIRRHDITTSQTRSGVILSAKDGLAMSDSLPVVGGVVPVSGVSVNTGVMIPYDQWYVPHEHFRDTEAARLHAITQTTKSTRADALFELVKLYMAEGWGPEAGGVLRVIKQQFPDYYVANKLALLSAAANVMSNHIDDAAADLQAPELTGVEEAMPWREVVALYAPSASAAQLIQQAVAQQNAPPVDTAGTDAAHNLPGPPMPPTAVAKPVFHYLKYHKSFIRFYPPRIRQRLVQLAADAYIADDQQEKALAAFDTLMRDEILGPVQNDANYALGTVAEKKGEFDKALEIYDKLATHHEDRYNAARGRVAAAMLRYTKGKITGEEAAEILESVRTGWRGDALERSILTRLITIYNDQRRYDEVLRTQKNILDGFPSDPNTLQTATEMSELFEHVFLDGLDKEMPPLKALSLFYEFREMTPLGEKGDKVIQMLADRLAAIDLLDRATQLLAHQVKFRATGEARSQIGARLALLHLLNHKPQEALDVLEVTNYGGNPPELALKRQQLTAEALTKLGKHEEALGVILNDSSKTGALLKLDILWAMQDWPNVVNHAEDILSTRQNLTEPLSQGETEVLLKLALGYIFEGDYTQLRYLRDYYSTLIPDTAYKQIFDYVTNDATPLDPADFALVAKQISNTESFLSQFKAKIAAGKLSETIK